jgi:ATP-dependent helicase/nuclease subunit A
LFALAWARKGSLRKTLERRSEESEKVAQAAARLDELAETARRETPFAFYAQLLGVGDARRRFLARLGPEAHDALDEFLNLALHYERRETPSLQGFVAWLRAARAEIKRDMEIARDEVRVMTVHGAKGLEAPIVILADTMTPPGGPRPPRLLTLPGGAVIWAGRKDDDVEAVATARTAALSEAEDEYRRLLYVGLTRAADKLIICGADSLNRRPDGCWYNLICRPLQPYLIEEAEGEEKVFRFRKPPGDVSKRTAAPAETARPEPSAIPNWLREPAPIKDPTIVAVSPSAAFDEVNRRTVSRVGASAAERRNALARGRIVHRLMQSLPDIPAAGRKDAIARYMKSAAADFGEAEQAEIAQQVLTILNDLIFAEVFASGSRAEVPIVGRIAREDGPALAVSGQVDRLAVTRDSVLIADFKTDRAGPHTLAEVPQPYIGQMALYRAVVAHIYPDKTIRAALIFTDGPIVMEVPGAAMDAAFAQIMGQCRKPTPRVVTLG